MRKIFTLLAIVSSLALAQQPVQLQTYNGGGAILLGNGVASGSLRVTLASDSTGQVTLASGASTIVTQATAANLNAAVVGVGTAGTPSGGVLSIQGVASGTAVPVSGTFSIALSTSSSQAFTNVHSSSAAAANIKASAGNFYGIDISNNGTIPCYLQLFNNAGTPTAGTSVVDSYMVQAGVSRTILSTDIALKNYTTGIAAAGATTDGGATTTGCTTTLSYTAYVF